MRILLIDDQKLLRHALIMVFKKLCETYPLTAEISTACSAEEGQRKTALSEYDFIALDEHYDQSILAKKGISRTSAAETPTLLLGPSAEMNTKNSIQFKKQESFHVLPHDGLKVGTDIADDLCLCANSPIVIICTGSPRVNYDFLISKPFTKERFVQMMEHNASGFASKGMIEQNQGTLCKHANLTLYNRA